MSEENLKVAVRVRPFNQREKDANSKLIVSMSGNQTLITNPKTNEEKKYAFDYSYWSHDGFKTESNGYFSPESSNYADQKKVFVDLGEGVLKNAWEGFNASLFAYGQTGSGKSYSVVGYGSNTGIVPMVCEDIFQKADAKKNSQITIEVTFSMLEIYSEVVRDLLNPTADRKTGLIVREDPKIGFYPQGLNKKLVDSYDDITKLMNEGTANRTIAATNMNATSSRAHTIVTVNLVQKYLNESGKEIAKSSMINLVDLAGSERANATGATGDRLKEGAAINLSLTSLGNVISALADNSSGKNVKVPYRDSVLTKLLMNALGGNSKTIMIAAISPAEINYDESLSTLRYADRAKQIKTKAMVNEDPTEKLIKDLKDENAKLKKMLENGKIDPELLKQITVTGKKEGEDEILKKQLEDNERKMKEMELSYEEKLKEAKTKNNTSDLRSQILEKAERLPHFSNVNMDSSLNGMIKIILEGQGQKIIGLLGKSDIPINGIGILSEHGKVTIDQNRIILERLNDSKILRNGQVLRQPTQLNHLDRLLFGTSQYYLFIDPSKSTSNDILFNFEMAQDEIAKSSGLIPNENKTNMNQEQMQCQNELVDLIPQIEEANAISSALDKKVCFSALPVSPHARGEYDGKLKAFVSVRNFATGLNWIWTKEKFLDRKVDMNEMYLDYQDDGIINRDKFKEFDAFYESPDTPTQIGTAMIYPKSLPYLIPYKNEVKILDLKSNEAGTINVEIIPCDSNGRPFNQTIQISDPNVQVLNQPISFIFKIGTAKILNQKYEDIYCVFQMYKDPNVYKSDVIRGTTNPDFKFSQNYTLTMNQDRLDFLLNKCLYIQIYGEQKHPRIDQTKSKLTTEEYLQREKLNTQNSPIGRVTNKVDPETEKLKEDLRVSSIKQARNEYTNNNVRKLLLISGGASIDPVYLDMMMQATNDQEVNRILDEYSKLKRDKDTNKGDDKPGKSNHQFGMTNMNQFDHSNNVFNMMNKNIEMIHKQNMEMVQRNISQTNQHIADMHRNNLMMHNNAFNMSNFMRNQNTDMPNDNDNNQISMNINYANGSQACLIS